MQNTNDSNDDNILNEFLTHTPKKNSLDDMTFGRTPIKTPKSINKISSENKNLMRRRIITKSDKDEKPGMCKLIINNYSTGGNNLAKNLQPDQHQNNFGMNMRRKKEESIKISRTENLRSLNPSRRAGLAPKKNFTNELKEIENDDMIIDMNDNDKKKKKDWKSWSSQEKELFYEAIANGGCASSLQKLFKGMNDVKLIFIFKFFFLNF
jgi:hypothetical protein